MEEPENNWPKFVSPRCRQISRAASFGKCPTNILISLTLSQTRLSLYLGLLALSLESDRMLSHRQSRFLNY